MRTFSHVVQAFLGGCALTTLIGCEEVVPPRPVSTPVSTPLVAASPVAVAPTAPPPPRATTAPAIAEVKPPIAGLSLRREEALDGTPLLSAARDALAHNELDRALRLARLAVKKTPSRSAAWNTMGRVQLRRGERKEAIASFEEAVDRNPTSSFAQNNLGLALIYDGRFEEAADALEEATSQRPVEGYMWNNLGMAYEHLDRLEEARDAYRQASVLKADRAGENLARLTGVKTIRTAKREVIAPEELQADDHDREPIAAPDSEPSGR